MKTKLSKIIVTSIILAAISSPVYAESLFRTGVSQNAYAIQPRPLFSSVRARTIGDIVTIVINEEVETSDDLKMNIKKSSAITDNFSSLINRFLPFNLIPNVDKFGGGSQTGNQSTIARKTTVNNTITAQVVQILPNGNLVVQGKKTALNSVDRVEVLLSGIIDPRLLDSTGKIDSSLVANLQIGVIGKGTISNSGSDGTVNKALRYFF